MENIIFVGFAVSFLSLMFAHVYVTNAFFSRLKEAHEATWKELGQPRWMIHFGDKSFQNAMKYIRQKKFTDLNDAQLESAYKKLKGVEYTAFGIALIIVIITIIDIL